MLGGNRAIFPCPAPKFWAPSCAVIVLFACFLPFFYMPLSSHLMPLSAALVGYGYAGKRFHAALI
ncbi:hypothetical protein GV729_23950, partial [Pseudomonas sp. Fl4BN2]|nr:hypothetical protein [Pseudomonas sp. Fl4BN2]